MLICKNLKVNGRRTSLRLEPTVWDALYEVADLQGLRPAELVSRVENERGALSTSAALRLYLLDYYRRALSEVMTIQTESSATIAARRSVRNDFVGLSA